jgi:hypothetical protein
MAGIQAAFLCFPVIGVSSAALLRAFDVSNSARCTSAFFAGIKRISATNPTHCSVNPTAKDMKIAANTSPKPIMFTIPASFKVAGRSSQCSGAAMWRTVQNRAIRSYRGDSIRGLWNTPWKTKRKR